MHLKNLSRVLFNIALSTLNIVKEHLFNAIALKTYQTIKHSVGS